MSKKEFYDYIKSFGKTPGDYTDDEVYAIGIAHKTLPKGDKNWQELVNLLGVKKSPEALRVFIARRQKEKGTLPKNIREISSESMKEISLEDVSGVIDEKLNTLFKEQQKNRDLLSSYRRNLRDDARIESMKSLIAENIKQIPMLKKVTYKSKQPLEDKCEAILMVSDLHLGVDCNNFYNTYNYEIAQKRLIKLRDDTIKYCQLHKVKRLTVINLGDMIHGIIHTSARVEQQFDVIQQVIYASELLANLLNDLQVASPEIIYRSVVDNHARIMADKNQSIEKENFNRLIDWYLESRLSNSKVKFLKDNLDIGLGKFKLFNGKNVIFAHGHEDSIDKSLQNFTGATEEFIHYVLLGHFHSEKMKTYQGIRVIVNGSIVGTEQYALSKRLFSKPSQKLLIFSEDDLVDISISLDIK